MEGNVNDRVSFYFLFLFFTCETYICEYILFWNKLSTAGVKNDIDG
ncbi:hypothetical protein SAMN04515625_0791 [Methanohalophilus halophilus]|uniref:Uncharacterized protein n=1 Tax=Methanohalophilus halophilus TaxID=2177 RepID=A0A1H2SUZ0_9EURY|nr:hypothetical protein SAMN04515625_0791 [Methanohalophilus halophilus]